MHTAPVIHAASLGASSHGLRRSVRLDENLDDAKFTLVKCVVQFSHILERHSVSDHERRVKLSGDDIVVENLVPVQVDWCCGYMRSEELELWEGKLWLTLTIPNQPNPLLHHRPNIQSIRVSSVGSNDPDPSHLLYRQKRFVQGFAHISLQ